MKVIPAERDVEFTTLIDGPGVEYDPPEADIVREIKDQCYGLSDFGIKPRGWICIPPKSERSERGYELSVTLFVLGGDEFYSKSISSLIDVEIGFSNGEAAPEIAVALRKEADRIEQKWKPRVRVPAGRLVA